jgi:pre-mRNA-splicing factor ATP-dependent RNA helicase DHX15/PRP43
MASEGKKRTAPDGERPPKRSKSESTNPSTNPYLAHIYGGDSENGVSPWDDFGGSSSNGGDSVLSTFKRHNTTAKQAQAAEDGVNNPFNGKPLSNQYFKILHTRRNLPVHAQR